MAITQGWTARRLQAHANRLLSQALAPRTSRLFVRRARSEVEGVVFDLQLQRFDATDRLPVPRSIAEMSLVLLPPEAAARVARAKLWLGGWAFWLTGVDAAWLEDEARLPLDFVPTNAFKTFLDPKLASVELIASALERS